VRGEGVHNLTSFWNRRSCVHLRSCRRKRTRPEPISNVDDSVYGTGEQRASSRDYWLDVLSAANATMIGTVVGAFVCANDQLCYWVNGMGAIRELAVTVVTCFFTHLVENSQTLNREATHGL